MFEIDFTWAGRQAPEIPGAPTLPTVDRNSPMLIALQEQLGLKLETTAGPVEVLAIDHVEQPAPD